MSRIEGSLMIREDSSSSDESSDEGNEIGTDALVNDDDEEKLEVFRNENRQKLTEVASGSTQQSSTFLINAMISSMEVGGAESVSDVLGVYQPFNQTMGRFMSTTVIEGSLTALHEDDSDLESSSSDESSDDNERFEGNGAIESTGVIGDGDDDETWEVFGSDDRGNVVADPLSPSAGGIFPKPVNDDDEFDHGDEVSGAPAWLAKYSYFRKDKSSDQSDQDGPPPSDYPGGPFPSPGKEKKKMSADLTGDVGSPSPKIDKCVVCSLSDCKERPLRLKKLNCNHTICMNCLEGAYTEAMVTRPKLGFAVEEFVTTCLHFESIPVYGEPITEKHKFHTLRKIPCPENGCEEIGSDLVADLDAFIVDTAGRVNEFEDYTKLLKICRKCILNDLVCFEEYQPIHLFTQLGCEHFVHPSCLSSWLKSEISKANEAQDACEPIVCYECKLTKQQCYCPMCSMSRPDNRGHVITEAEVRGLTKDPTSQFAGSDLDAFNKVAGMACFRADKDERRVCCLNCSSRYLVNNRIRELLCSNCFREICCLCGRTVHEGLSCEEFERRETLQNLNESGEGQLLQSCPFCKQYWGFPLNCMHATCDEKLKGCGGEFCFPCAAPRTPTMVHGTWFHRPQCPYFNNICCDNNCVKENAERCVNDKYWPGPCGECRKLDSHWNKCQHSEWRPCRSCLEISEKCLHFCTECRRQGRTCSRPGNPRGADGQLEFRVFSQEELNEAQRIL